jgi:ethanolamine utilization cobalamin adenosyltransferase
MSEYKESDSKPEGLTHLYGNQLTEKDNPIIAFRGKLDKLCAMILEAQLLGEEKENRAFVDDLQEILEFTRSLLPAEYKCIPLGEFSILGLSSKELREQSHHPEKYFGHEHLLMHRSMGALCLRLNLLRTVTREVELAAVTTLRNLPKPPDPTRRCREDIVEALNRLSSLFYILIFKYLPKDYSPVGSM